ncbi:hypothetical protein [Roseateles asaccharophilus]|uniref:Uncharacterized protein n=1 Tax=Roseateles asaccharophilus TaxID=582607 RepID=A0ABU2AAP9_9BURK|nr:hypothetical protein [Roseateles asaccharophilus]MDR7334277.1 hypothetical protein [Roseateles asaccharophilus]
MPAGSLENVIVCRPSATPAAPCGAGEAPTVLQAYVLAPSSSSFVDAAAGPYDYATGAAYWSAAFVFTVSLYLCTRVIGTIVNMVR